MGRGLVVMMNGGEEGSGMVVVVVIHPSPYTNHVCVLCSTVSSPQFGEAHKAPQEHIPVEKKEEVTRLLLSAFERAIGVPGGGGAQPLLRPTVTFCQLWGAANPISVATRPADQAFIFQGEGRVMNEGREMVVVVVVVVMMMVVGAAAAGGGGGLFIVVIDVGDN